MHSGLCIIKNTLSQKRKERRGFAPYPTRGMIPLDPSPGEVAWMDLPTDSACRAGDYESLRASGPRKPGKSPGGKLAFPGGLFPGFPRMLCIRVGRQRRPGQKHNGGKFCYPFQATAGICFLSASGNIRRRGCRGSSPAVGSGAAEAPACFLT